MTIWLLSDWCAITFMFVIQNVIFMLVIMHNVIWHTTKSEYMDFFFLSLLLSDEKKKEMTRFLVFSKAHPMGDGGWEFVL